jgi:hypothetical protein
VSLTTPSIAGDCHELVDPKECGPANPETTEYRYPWDDKQKMTHVAVRYPQTSPYREQWVRQPSRDDITETTIDGTRKCFELQAFDVAMRPYWKWCVELYEFKRKGRLRQMAFWGLTGVTVAAAVAVAAPLAVPALGLVHLGAGTAAAIGAWGAALGPAAGAAATGVAFRIQAVPKGTVKVGQPVKKLVCKGFGKLHDPPPTDWQPKFQPGTPRVCVSQTKGDHDHCR